MLLNNLLLVNWYICAILKINKLKMKKRSIYLILFLILTQSCNTKNVKLPLNNNKGIQDTIYENSKIWIFYSIKGKDTIAVLNRKNSIANTHTIFNIDKRLTLKQIKDKVNKVQLKKEKPSMHSNGKYMHSYLSYVDTNSNLLSMVLFDSVKFKPLTEMKRNTNALLVKQTPNTLFLNNTEITFVELNKRLIKYKDSSKQKVNLLLDGNLSYDKYVNLKGVLQQIKIDSLSFNVNEFIF
jgi:biopolymer transport protein ExbD